MPEASLHKASLQGASAPRAYELESIISLSELINKAKNPLRLGSHMRSAFIYLLSKHTLTHGGCRHRQGHRISLMLQSNLCYNLMGTSIYLYLYTIICLLPQRDIRHLHNFTTDDRNSPSGDILFQTNRTRV